MISMTKYDVRRERIRTETQAAVNTIKNYENITNNIVTGGAKLINQIGSTIQSQQASDWLDKRDAAMNEAMRNGEFTFKTDADGNKSPMSYDEMIQARENWIKDYSESNPAPWGPWADSIIKKADKSSKQKWDSQITEQAVQVMQNTVRQNAKNAIQSYQDGQYHDPDDIMTSLGVTYETLSPTARSLYDSAMDKDNPDRILASQNFGTQLQFERAGLPENVAYSTVKSSYQPVFAMNNNIQAAVQTFSEQVVSGQMTQADFQLYLDDYAEKLGVDGYGGFTQSLSITGKEDFKTSVNNALASIIEGETERNTRIFDEQIRPIMQDFRNRKEKTFNSKVAAEYEKQLGINMDFVEYKDSYDKYVGRQDSIEKALQANKIAENINRLPYTDEQKRSMQMQIASTMRDSGAYDLFVNCKDSTPTKGRYLMYSTSEMIDRYSGDFILPTFDIGNGSRAASAGSVGEAYTRDAEEFASDPVNLSNVLTLALSDDPDVMASGIWSINNAMRIFEATMTDEQRQEYMHDIPDGGGSVWSSYHQRFKIQRNIDEVGSIYMPLLYRSEKMNEDFYNWLDKKQSEANTFIMNYGDMKIGDTTLKDLYESQKAEAIEFGQDMLNGYHAVKDNNLESERIRKTQVRQWTINALKMDNPYEAQQYLQDYFYRFTKEEQKFYNAMLNPENGYNTILTELNINMDNLRDELGIKRNDSALFSTIMYTVLEKNQNAILNSIQNPSATSGIYEQIKTDARKEYQAFIQNSVGEYKNGQLKGPDSLDDYSDPSYFMRRRSSDNMIDSAFGRNALNDTIDYLNSNPAEKNAFYGDITIDKSNIKDKDRIVWAMGRMLDYEVDINNITDSDRSIIWDLYSNSGFQKEVDTGVTYIMGLYYDIKEAREWGLDLENYRDGVYYNSKGTREFIIEHAKDGSISSIKERKAGSGDMFTHDMFSDMLGSGLDYTMDKMSREVNKAMNIQYSPFDDYSNLMNTEGSFEKAEEFVKDEYSKFISDYEDITGRQLDVLAEYGPRTEPLQVKLYSPEAVSTEKAKRESRNTKTTLKDASSEFSEEFGRVFTDDVINSSDKSISDTAQPYIDEIMASDKWQGFVSDYEKNHKGKTVVPVLKMIPGGFLKTRYEVRFEERNK